MQDQTVHRMHGHRKLIALPFHSVTVHLEAGPLGLYDLQVFQVSPRALLVSRIETSRMWRHGYHARVLHQNHLLIRHVHVANQTMDGASVAIVCRIFAHKGDTANRPMPFWQLDHGIPACRPWVNLNTLKIFIGVAGNPSGFHCCQPFGMVLGQLNGNTQIQITVRGLSLIG